MIGQNYTLQDFKTIPVPSTEDLIQANYPTNDIKIYKVNDSIRIESDDSSIIGDILPFSKKYIRNKFKTGHEIESVKKVQDGYIIGLNGGEFGGSLWFLSLDGKYSYRIATNKNVVQIFEFNAKIYVIEGLSHMSYDKGSLFQIEKSYKWKVVKTYKLLGAPRFAKLSNEAVFIITTNAIVSFNREEKLKQILAAPFDWRFFYPSSGVIDNDTIYIAMRKGILKISSFQNDPQYHFLVKK